MGRESLVRDKVKTTNQLQVFLLEFGIRVPKDPTLIKPLTEILKTNALPLYITGLRQKLREHYDYLVKQIKELETQQQVSLVEDSVLSIRPFDHEPLIQSTGGGGAVREDGLLYWVGNKKLRTQEHRSGKHADWVRELLLRKNNFVVTCALAIHRAAANIKSSYNLQ